MTDDTTRRLFEKLDALADGQAKGNERLTRLETKIEGLRCQTHDEQLEAIKNALADDHSRRVGVEGRVEHLEVQRAAARTNWWQIVANVISAGALVVAVLALVSR